MPQDATKLTPAEVIRKIADVAWAVGWQAGVGGMETAGSIVSVLAAHPEKIEAFLSGELTVIDDDALLRPELGCLTWHAKNGSVMTPVAARSRRNMPDH